MIAASSAQAIPACWLGHAAGSSPDRNHILPNSYFLLAELFAFFGLGRLGAAFLAATFLATAFFLGAAFFLVAGAFLTAAFFLAFGAFPSPTFCARLPSAEPTAIAAFFNPSSSSIIFFFANLLSRPECTLYGRTTQ